LSPAIYCWFCYFSEDLITGSEVLSKTAFYMMTLLEALTGIGLIAIIELGFPWLPLAKVVAWTFMEGIVLRAKAI